MRLFAEIVGPSGAGKSQLSTVLNELNPDVKAGLTVWGLPRTSLAFGGLRSMRDLTTLAIERRAIRTSEVKQVIRLSAFYRTLGDDRFESFRYLFIDEGAVFALAKLRADIGFESFGRRMKRWESAVIDRWSSRLDLIVWLDAADDVLIRRVRTRRKPHRMKYESEATMRYFLSRYRAAYREILDEFASRAEIPVLSFRNDDRDLYAVAKEIVAACRRLEEEKAAKIHADGARVPVIGAPRVSLNER